MLPQRSHAGGIHVQQWNPGGCQKSVSDLGPACIENSTAMNIVVTA
jgi:hypothetical protein